MPILIIVIKVSLSATFSVWRIIRIMTLFIIPIASKQAIIYNRVRGDIMTFGERLKSLRSKHEFTQEQLATMLGTKKATISNYETGYSEPSFDVLIKISRIFEVTTDYLLGNHVKDVASDEWKQRAMKAERRIDELTEIVDYFTKAFNDIPTFAKVMIRAQVLLEEE